MKIGLIRTLMDSFFFLLLGTFLFGCAGSTPSPSSQEGHLIKESELPSPTKNIIVSKGDLNKPYDILGEVNCSIDGKYVYGNYDDFGKEIEDLCRKEAFSKYGNRVDAIINMNGSLNINERFWGQMGAAYGARNSTVTGSGISVRFK